MSRGYSGWLKGRGNRRGGVVGGDPMRGCGHSRIYTIMILLLKSAGKHVNPTRLAASLTKPLIRGKLVCRYRPFLPQTDVNVYLPYSSIVLASSQSLAASLGNFVHKKRG